MNSLETLAKTTGKSVTDIMEPHKEVLQDMIPPKKHLLRHQPANAQIGLMVISCSSVVMNKMYYSANIPRDLRYFALKMRSHGILFLNEVVGQGYLICKAIKVKSLEMLNSWHNNTFCS